MKKNESYKIKNLVLVLSLMLFSLSGCDSDWIDSDLNIDPDSPGDVPMGLILPGVQQSMGYVLAGNDNVRTNNIWMQHFDGVSRQSFTEARYQLTSADVGNLWDATYTSMLMNLDRMVLKSKAENFVSPHFTGVGQVMQATTLGITTDIFGDIPFSDALGGEQGNLKPAYDTQEKIYDTIFELLDNAVLNLASEENVLEVTGDVIYGGDLDKWTKAAYSIKARHYLQLSNVLGDQAYTMALAAVEKGFASNDDNYFVPFEDANRNPIFQFMEQRGDITMGATFVNFLDATAVESKQDPRLPFYVAENADGEFVGSEAGSENASASLPGPYAAAPDSPVYLMTYAELKFIEAEAQLGLGNQELAKDAFQEAVAASVLMVTGEANTTWLDANINNLPTVTLEGIITQKYINGYATNQPYNDYRRTGFPTLTLAQGAVLSQIPVRFPYPQSELDYNTDNVPAARQLTDKVWWDQ